eukprot:XP_017949744.1 PREDICTED: uncharacterized protein LOC100489674 [Xenopus tropicalis]
MIFLSKTFLFCILLYLLTVNVLPASSCLSCEPSTKEIENKFLYFAEDLYWRKRENFYAIRNFIQEFADLVKTRYQQKTIDRFGMEMLFSEYKRKLTKIQNKLEKEFNDDKTALNIVEDLTPSFKELAQSVEEIFTSFEDRKCPNKKEDNCGILLDKVTNCDTCKEELMVCAGGSDTHCIDLINKCPLCHCNKGKCSDLRTKEPCTPCEGYSNCVQKILPCETREIQVEEEADLNFDCSVAFHHEIHDEMEYILEKKQHSTVIPIQTFSQPNYVKYLADFKDVGDYSCTARSRITRFPISKVDFKVEVVNTTRPTEASRETLPPYEPPAPDRDLTLYIAVAVLIICTLLVIALIVCLIFYIRWDSKTFMDYDVEQQKNAQADMIRMTGLRVLKTEKIPTEDTFSPSVLRQNLEMVAEK